jgi:hypothetical protein
MISTHRRLFSSLVLALALTACSGGSSSQEGATPPPDDDQPSGDENERALLTPEECTARGGSVVGDIGDGATHRPDYLCANGAPPLGNVPLGIEGSVCCGM